MVEKCRLTLNLVFCIDSMRLQEVEQDGVEANVEINVSLSVLPDFFLGVDQNQLMKNGDIEIKGDAHIASVLQNTFRAIEIDWEDILAKYLGDTVAYQVGKGAKRLREFALNARDNTRMDVRDYLQDNLQVAPTKEEVDEFISEVDKVRAQMDRLEARAKRL